MAYIEVSHETKRYQSGTSEILANNDVSFTCEKGELVVILGSSGAGKSTLLNILGGMDTAKNPKILLCDEPTGALDYRTGKQVLQILEDMSRKRGATVIIVTHNAAIAPIADRVIRMHDARVQASEVNEKKEDSSAGNGGGAPIAEEVRDTVAYADFFFYDMGSF